MFQVLFGTAGDLQSGERIVVEVPIKEDFDAGKLIELFDHLLKVLWTMFQVGFVDELKHYSETSFELSKQKNVTANEDISIKESQTVHYNEPLTVRVPPRFYCVIFQLLDETHAY